MPSFTVKNIPEPLYKRLKRLAHLHHRSVNSEIIEALEKSTTSVRMDSDAVLARAREMRGRVLGEVTDASLASLKDQGRRR